jgi:hypothetical protein
MGVRLANIWPKLSQLPALEAGSRTDWSGSFRGTTLLPVRYGAPAINSSSMELLVAPPCQMVKGDIYQ